MSPKLGRARADIYLPEWVGPIEGWVHNSIKTHYWRIKRTHDRLEYLQDAHVTFLRCAAKYPVLDTGAHFMSLFQRAWLNDLNDLSRSASKLASTVSDSTVDQETGEPWLHETIGELNNEGYLSVLLREAPQEVLMVLNLFLNTPGELLELATSAWKRAGHRGGDTNNIMISRLLGLDPALDVLKKTREYLEQ